MPKNSFNLKLLFINNFSLILVLILFINNQYFYKMEKPNKLFMLMLGCRPEGRFTEQHDIFFGIAQSLKELVPNIIQFWPEAKGKIHIDAWREVTQVNGFDIVIVNKNEKNINENQLFFINLGGYKENEFEEYHYKVLAVAENLASASHQAKQTTFYKHCGFAGAPSHIDDKFGVDIDDLYKVSDILDKELLQKFNLKILKSESITEDELHIGYLPIVRLLDC